jgi:hypothetical protein
LSRNEIVIRGFRDAKVFPPHVENAKAFPTSAYAIAASGQPRVPAILQKTLLASSPQIHLGACLSVPGFVSSQFLNKNWDGAPQTSVWNKKESLTISFQFCHLPVIGHSL